MEQEKIKEFLVKQLGFVNLTESKVIKEFGELIWEVDGYESYIRPRWERKPFEVYYTEGMEKVLYIRTSWFYSMEVYRIVKFDLYLIHIKTGPFERYFRIETYDMEKLEKISQIEVSEGFLYIGSQYDLREVLAQALKMLEPVEIEVF